MASDDTNIMFYGYVVFKLCNHHHWIQNKCVYNIYTE